MNTLKIDSQDISHAVSNTLFGLFLEDINFSVDGGLNANMVNNHAFNSLYIKRKGGDLAQMILKKTPKLLFDHLRYWNTEGKGKIHVSNENSLSASGTFARVSVRGVFKMENLGYNGGRENRKKCAMGLFENTDYDFSIYIRNKDFVGKISIHAADDTEKIVSDTAFLNDNGNFRPHWEQYSLKLRSKATTTAKLVIIFEGKGTLDLDFVNFSNSEYWGKNDPKWSQGHLRKDLVESLKALKPTFLRFPGGCIVEGTCAGNEYEWKKTVGPLITRLPKFNLWGARQKDGGYTQSNQIGFYEYFLLCEDLGAAPMPIVWAGLNCQFRTKDLINSNDPKFDEEVIQNALDLIEYANGDPDKSRWARLRAEAGHPAPFHLKFLGIGNENWGKIYLDKFGLIKDAIEKQHPGIICILSAGPFPDGKNYEMAWAYARKNHPNTFLDEHFYKYPNWVFKHVNRYDNFSRDGPKVFLGEYAANSAVKPLQANTYQTALAEAAFLTGIEQNSDVVTMTSYAPLFSLSGGEQWSHNLINFNPHYVLKTANYLVQRMFATNLGEKLIDTSHATMPSGIYNSVTCDREHIHVKLVNTTNKYIPIHVLVRNYTIVDVKMEILHSDNLKARNKILFKGIPEYVIPYKEKSVDFTDDSFDLNMENYSIYVLTISI